tara:strand:- start:129 stop:1163 length:1035 start_codon:yes stop_codon:yes gene_type:complete
MILFISISIPLVLFILAIIFVGQAISTQPYRGPVSDHFDGSKFINPGNVSAKGFPDLIKFLVGRDQGPWTKNYETFVGKKPKAPEKGQVKITFVNHSTFLIQWEKYNILTDPVWSDRCSPFNFVGPQRMRPPGLRFEDLPQIDLVLLSHNHYDHLDISTVIRLEKAFQPTFVVPLGVSDYLKKNDIENTVELDWWEKTNQKPVITAVPAQHFSGRGFYDRDKSLWCGYVIEFQNKKIYFAGDSGYGSFFKDIGKKFGPMDISMIPIGAYLPAWFMSPIHVSPQESIKIHKDVKSKQSIAMHFGTFPLADDGMGRAEKDLMATLKKTRTSQENFLIPDEGKPIIF